MTSHDPSTPTLAPGPTARKLARIADCSSDGILFAAPDGTITYANPAVVRALGYEHADDLVGRKTQDLYADPAVRDLLMRLMGREDHIEAVQFELGRRDGSTLKVIGSMFAVRDDDGELLERVGVATDLSSRDDEQAQLERQAALLRAMQRVLELPSRTDDEIELASAVLEVACGLTGSEIGVLGERVGDRFRIAGVLPRPLEGPVAVELPAEIPARGVIAWITDENASVITNDSPAHPLFGGGPEGHPELRSFVGVPVPLPGDHVGLLGLANNPHGYDAFDRGALETLASAVGAAWSAVRHRADR